MDRDSIRKLKKDPYFIQFQKTILLKIDELNSIGGMEKMSVKKAGETVKARAIAAGILHDVLSPFFDFKEKREPTAEEIQKVKTKTGL